MPRSDIDICNRALARCGAKDIASLTENTAEARACAREFTETLDACLTTPGGQPFRWSFATAQVALSRLTDVPVARYAYAWQVPNDCLVIHAVMVDSVPIEFTRLDDMIYCDADADAVAEYTFRADVAALPAYFVEALTTDMASRIAVGLNRDMDLGKSLAGQAQGQWAGARSADSQARSARRIRATRLKRSRFGAR